MKKFPSQTAVAVFLLFFAFLFTFNALHAQQRVFASSVSSSSHAEDLPLATDLKLNTAARLLSSSGSALGTDAYQGHLELRFPQPLAGGTTSYLKIQAEEGILEPLLGGSLEDFLSDVLGIVLIGNQELLIEAKLGETVIHEGSSPVFGDFEEDALRVVVDAEGNYYLAITPATSYDRLRVTNRLGSLIGLNITRYLDVYGAFYYSAPFRCGETNYVTYDGYGLTTDLLHVGGAGVLEPHHLVDGDPATYSQLSLGIVNALSYIEETVLVAGGSISSDEFSLTFALDPSLLALGVLSNVEIIGENQDLPVFSFVLADLVNLEVLGLLQDYQPATVRIAPGQEVDRVTIRYSALLNTSLSQRIDLYDFQRIPAQPNIQTITETVCEGEPATLVATAYPMDLELRWYATPSGGTLLGTTSSGQPFTTEPILADITYYVATARPGCLQESSRIAIPVSMIEAPSQSELAISGNETPICEGQPVTLTPFSERQGSFHWFMDASGQNEIADGHMNGETTYTISETGQLTITGLEQNTSVFLAMTDEETACMSPVSEFLQADVEVRERPTGLGIILDANITEDDTINAEEANGTVVLTGSAIAASAGDTFTVTINDQEYSGMLEEDLSFVIVVPGGDLADDADHTIDIRLVHVSGPCSSEVSDTESYQVDLDGPTVPTVDPLVTADATPLLSGSCDSSAFLQVLVNGIWYEEGDGALVDHGDGTWELQVPAGNDIPEGTYDIIARAQDSAGNQVSDTTTDELTIDQTPPGNPTVNPLATADSSPEIYGTAESDGILEVILNGVTYTEGDGNLEDLDNDTWKLSVPVSDVLADGTYDVLVNLVDEAGNSSSDLTTDELVIDTSLPVTPTVDPLLTTDRSPTITGTAQSADDLEVEVNGIIYNEGDGQLTDLGDDTWSLQVPEDNILPDGVYDVRATATQDSKSASDASLDELEIDTTPPGTPTVDALLTADATPVLTGTAPSEDTLSVTVNGITYNEGDGNLVDNGDDTWSLQVPESAILPEGTYDVQAVVTDDAGLSSSDATADELEIDQTPPPVPTVTPLLSSSAIPTLSGTADSEGDLEVVVNGITYNEGDGYLTDHGDGTWTLELPSENSLPDGIYDIQATVKDESGNTSSDATTDELTIDSTAPAAPTVNPLVTNDGTPLLSGSADSEHQLIVQVDGVTYSEGDGFLVDHGDNTWSLEIPAVNQINDGVYDITATLTDEAGNIASDGTVDELTVDSAVPGIPTVEPMVTASDNPVLNGTAPSKDTLQVTFNGTTYTEGDGYLVDHGDGTWTLNLPEETVIEEGTYEVIVTVEDAAGNASSDTSSEEVVIDRTAPAIPTVDFLETEDSTPFLTGTASSADHVEVTVNGITYTEGDGYLVDHEDGTWSLEIPIEGELLEGTYDIVVQSIDQAGNTSVDITSGELVLLSHPAAELALTLTMTVDKAVSLIGETVTYTITVSNDGDFPVEGLVFLVQLGNFMEISDYLAGSGLYSPTSGTWQIDFLEIGESLVLTIEAFGNSSGTQTGVVTLAASAPAHHSESPIEATTELTVSCLQVFNEFTPNRDGKNDTFRISCIEHYPDAEIRVFNRYGNLVFQTKNYTNDWEGVANVPGVFNSGEPLPSATYFYILKLDKDSPEKRGWLFIKR